ncbi:DUF4326 domain-containing protein [Micromonospora echinospora]
MGSPKAIQRSRQKGWRKPAGAVIVTRPSRFGNPFTAADVVACGYAEPANARAAAVHLFDSWLNESLGVQKPPQEKARLILLAHLHQLVGKDLACYCPLPAPGEPDLCHRSVLLARVNRPRTAPRTSFLGGLVVTAQRYCNGCDARLGDASAAELDASAAGLPLPDVRGECLFCGPAYAQALIRELAGAGR